MTNEKLSDLTSDSGKMFILRPGNFRRPYSVVISKVSRQRSDMSVQSSSTSIFNPVGLQIRPSEVFF